VIQTCTRIQKTPNNARTVVCRMYGNSEIPLKQFIFDEDESVFCAKIPTKVLGNPRKFTTMNYK